MFTGIIEELGTLRQIVRGTASARLKIEARHVLEGTRAGDSIAVNGVCLTVTALDKNFFTADVMAETLAKTNLGQLAPGDRVNLERALRLDARLGGHLVSGHIDGVGTILRREPHDIATLLTVGAPAGVMRYIIKKGSVAIDGISLTVIDFNDSSFQVSLIPHTAALTTLGFKRPGDTVNLEADLIGKYVERLLLQRENGCREKLSLAFLAEHGFME
ncbi:MAG: riboflavin synthase [Bacillota bacterium]